MKQKILNFVRKHLILSIILFMSLIMFIYVLLFYLTISAESNIKEENINKAKSICVPAGYEVFVPGNTYHQEVMCKLPNGDFRSLEKVQAELKNKEQK